MHQKDACAACFGADSKANLLTWACCHTVIDTCSLYMVVSAAMKGCARKEVHGRGWNDVTSVTTDEAHLDPVAAAQSAAVYVSCFLQCPSHACHP